MESCLEDWVGNPLKEFVETVRTIDDLSTVEKEEREKLYCSFRELYNLGIIGTNAWVELKIQAWENTDGTKKLPEDFQERLDEKIKNNPLIRNKEKRKDNGDKNKEPLTLDYLINLASSYLTEVSQYILTETGTENTTPEELMKAIKITFDKEFQDDEDLFILELSEEYISDFNVSPEEAKFGGGGLYEFVDFCQYLHHLKKEIKLN